jgi:hypothetical protein
MKTVSPRKVPQFAIDAIDRRILAALQEGASMTNVDLAGKVGLPRPLASPASARASESSARAGGRSQTISRL